VDHFGIPHLRSLNFLNFPYFHLCSWFEPCLLFIFLFSLFPIFVLMLRLLDDLCLLIDTTASVRFPSWLSCSAFLFIFNVSFVQLGSGQKCASFWFWYFILCFFSFFLGFLWLCLMVFGQCKPGVLGFLQIFYFRPQFDDCYDYLVHYSFAVFQIRLKIKLHDSLSNWHSKAIMTLILRSESEYATQSQSQCQSGTFRYIVISLIYRGDSYNDSNNLKTSKTKLFSHVFANIAWRRTAKQPTLQEMYLLSHLFTSHSFLLVLSLIFQPY